ncbi:MAG: thiamine diphosphokinase [Ruminococcus sp.]|nr:thiamine diphosphokinase [Ruminococcus sp.]
MAEKELKKCIIVCASPNADSRFVRQVITPDDYIIAADGGMALLKKAGLTPNLFVGDFDSFSGDVPDGVEIIKLKTRKDDTDSMHCAEVAAKRGFREVRLLGATGGSPSHTFSNYCVLSFLEAKGICAVMSDTDGDIRVFGEGVYSFNNLSGHEFSVFPFGCENAAVSYMGDVEYPARDLTLAYNSSLGKSNVFRSDNVIIAVKQGKVIVFISNKENNQ